MLAFSKTVNFWFFKMLIFIKHAFQNMFHGFSGYFLCILASLKNEIIGFGSQGPVQKSRNHENEGLGFSHKQIEKLLDQAEAK